MYFKFTPQFTREKDNEDARNEEKIGNKPGHMGLTQDGSKTAKCPC